MNAPSEFRPFHKLFKQLIYKHDVSRVFDDFLDYVIMGFTIDDSMNWDKSYTKSEIQIFYDMFVEYVNVMDQQLVSKHDWFDFIGTYYEAEIVSKLGQKYAGQFFTPPTLCDMMAAMNTTATNQSQLRINDPSCGSGRCLISFHVLSPGHYYLGQDLDLTCVKMTILNFLFHGMQGDVLWGNTLTNEFYDGWKVNESLQYTKGIPHIRKLNQIEINILTSIEKPFEAKSITLADFGLKGALNNEVS